MPRGRRPATRGVYAIEDPALILPEVLALDTSFVVEALIETQPLHAVCAGFVERIVEAAPTVVTSELLEVELAEAAESRSAPRRRSSCRAREPRAG